MSAIFPAHSIADHCVGCVRRKLCHKKAVLIGSPLFPDVCFSRYPQHDLPPLSSLLSCPQAALISLPNSRRTVAVI